MDTGKKLPKGPEIGLHQARRLCQLDESKRLTFIEGLPVILRSAQGFWTAAEQLQTSGVTTGYPEAVRFRFIQVTNPPAAPARRGLLGLHFKIHIHAAARAPE